MTKNPLLNALGASSYIVLVVSLMSYISQTQGNKPDTFLAPIIFLSMFTLSVAVMAFMFFYQPLLLIIDKKKKQAVTLFIQTVGIFAAFTFLALGLLFTGIIK